MYKKLQVIVERFHEAKNKENQSHMLIINLYLSNVTQKSTAFYFLISEEKQYVKWTKLYFEKRKPPAGSHTSLTPLIFIFIILVCLPHLSPQLDFRPQTLSVLCISFILKNAKLKYLTKAFIIIIIMLSFPCLYLNCSSPLIVIPLIPKFYISVHSMQCVLSSSGFISLPSILLY